MKDDFIIFMCSMCVFVGIIFGYIFWGGEYIQTPQQSIIEAQADLNISFQTMAEACFNSGTKQ